jgi:hypothetical protein
LPDEPANALGIWVRHRCRRQQRLGVGVQWAFEHVGQLNHRSSVAVVPDERTTERAEQ